MLNLHLVCFEVKYFTCKNIFNKIFQVFDMSSNIFQANYQNQCLNH